MLCIVPSVQFALNGFAGPDLRYASGLFNLMRNLGGAVGIAVVNTWLATTRACTSSVSARRWALAHSHAARTGHRLAAQIGRVVPDDSHRPC
jgi:DHA2 family multidrug resistance protein